MCKLYKNNYVKWEFKDGTWYFPKGIFLLEGGIPEAPTPPEIPVEDEKDNVSREESELPP